MVGSSRVEARYVHRNSGETVDAHFHDILRAGKFLVWHGVI